MTRAALARALRRTIATGALVAACGPPAGPAPIAWDEEPCAQCRMLISEPGFAAQLRAEDGSVESFDDPGCLLARQRERRTREIWFHHLREERWIPGDRVAFEPVSRTPMGYGLGAVDAGTEGALDLEAARGRVAERGAGR